MSYNLVKLTKEIKSKIKKITDILKVFGEINVVKVSVDADESGSVNVLKFYIGIREGSAEDVSTISLIKKINELEELLSLYEDLNIELEATYPKTEEEIEASNCSPDFDYMCEQVALFTFDTGTREYHGELIEEDMEKTLNIYSKECINLDKPILVRDEKPQFNVLADIVVSNDNISEIRFRSFERTQNLRKESKIKFNNLVKKINEAFDKNYPLKEVAVEGNTIDKLASELGVFTDKNIVKEVFKPMLRDTLNVNTAIYLTYSAEKDGGLFVKYYIDGHGFVWNAINRDPLQCQTIASVLYLMDKDKVGYLEQTHFHVNELTDANANNYENFLLEYFGDCIDYDEQSSSGYTHFVIRLDRGLIEGVVDKGYCQYFVNKSGEIIAMFEKSEIINRNLLKDKINNLLELISGTESE